MSTGRDSRRVAYETVRAVHDSDAYANLLLPTSITRAGLDTADAALATELTYGTLRRQGTYDAIIAIEFALQVKAAFAGTSTPVNLRMWSPRGGGAGFSASLLAEILQRKWHDPRIVRG